jgi:hypothetical protein
MASKYWIKFYIEALDDPKVARLPDNLWRRYYECCLLAGELDQDGRLPPIPHISWRLRTDEETIATEFDALARIGILDYRADNVLDGYWLVTNFAKRQAPVPGKKRVAQYRETQKKRQYYETSNEPVTKRYTDTESDIDTDSDTEYTQTPYSILLGAFEEASNIYSMGNLSKRDNEGLNQLVELRCIPEDVINAVKYNIDNGLSLIGVASIVNGAKIERAKRLNASKRSPLPVDETLSKIHQDLYGPK